MLVLENVVKNYQGRQGDVKALSDINLRIEKGEFVVICGPSGSGKTTLLMTIAAMLRPTSGSVRVEQNEIHTMSIRDRAKFRAENIGFVFQMFHLVPYLNIIENVVLAGGVADEKRGTVEANELLKQLGLAERAFHKPSELSAGEKQRTAVARALFNRPKIILADEPTGNLDPDNTASVLGFLSDFHHSGGTVILATHGTEAEQFADRVIHLQNGQTDSPQRTPRAQRRND
ncbi:MAG: ABC transporter ATP-binding protein [Planctomycetota bacterium]|jgi:ABC-type lipoprotein export system ATPase subunit